VSKGGLREIKLECSDGMPYAEEIRPGNPPNQPRGSSMPVF
jgi:hypothetical protein